MFLKKFSWEFTNEGSNLYFNSGPNYQRYVHKQMKTSA